MKIIIILTFSYLLSVNYYLTSIPYLLPSNVQATLFPINSRAFFRVSPSVAT